MFRKSRTFTRRDFMQLAVTTIGGMIGVSRRREPVVTVTATRVPTAVPVAQPSATITPSPSPTPATQIPTPSLIADTILLNGEVITMDRADTITQGVAIKDGLILQTGTNDTLRAFAGPNTQLLDLRGKTVTPGLIDSHNHLQVWGWMLSDYVPLNPPEVRTLDDLLAKVKKVVAQTPAGEWIQGYYWGTDPLPNRTHLDPIAPNHPLFLIQQGGHYASVNGLALQIAGITARTQNPEGGVIERDAQGEPTGMLYNHRAMDLVRMHIPRLSSQKILESLQFGEKKMLEVGVTTFHDVNVRAAALPVYLQAGHDHAMTLRAQVFYTLEWARDLEIALNQIEHYADAYMRFAGYKFLIDGQFPTFYTHEPHPGISWNMPTWNPDEFKRTVKALHDTGLQVTVHCGGDAAVDLVLDAYEAAMNANPRPDPRHRLEHAILMTPDAVKRAADLGVVISAQPQFIRLGAADDINAKFGVERARRIIVTREWLDAGIPLALGSDVPTTPWHEPQVTLAEAVLRADKNNQRFNPAQALTMPEALRAHTIGSAYAAFEEKVKGSLEPGKLADLAVWSDNPYRLRPADILRTQIEMTLIGGKIMHQRT